MADPLSADRLLRALRDEGLRVVEYRSWRTHNRNHKGPWGPVHGVMVHHTVTSGTDHSVALCYDGYAALPGPLCHGVIAKDGTVHLVGNGRANHAGLGDDDVLRAVIAEAPTLPPDNEANTDGNARFYGFEAINLGDGQDPWPAAQLDAIEKAAAAVCRAHGWTHRSVIGHLEWQPGKPDPRGFTMASMRSRIERRLARAPEGPAGPGTTPPTPAPAPVPVEEDPMPLDLNTRVPIGSWLPERWPDDPGLADRVLLLRTLLVGAYAYGRAALEEATAARAAAEEAAAALRELAPDRPALDLTPEQLDHIADRIGERIAAQVVDLIAARLAD
ncbi:peptidoglycan recognition protein family protein [Streptomyces sp. C10-9-1]|uniref:peptidoglycan recognition protein family protein n=1 Tax=Streptomyces sp. C10-9-1 TaxID=1859285 RepID=UPI003F49B5B5